MRNPTVAIMSMMRDPGPSISTWLEYHLQLVDQIYIYVDKPGQGDEALFSGFANVRVFAGSQNIDEYMARQSANAGRGLEQAREDGVDWLLHIDADELIWTRDQDLRTYLAGLDRDINSVSFTNHEVVSTFDDVQDCFKDLQLFKRNGPLSEADNWLFANGQQFFRAYGNGKSVGRVAQCKAPNGPHGFVIGEGRTVLEAGISILHYVCPTYRDWFKKYEQLGDFSNYYWDDKRLPIQIKFHTDSRDAFLLARRELDWTIAENFYKSRLFTEDEIARLLATDAVFRADPVHDLKVLKAAQSDAKQPASQFDPTTSRPTPEDVDATKPISTTDARQCVFDPTDDLSTGSMAVPTTLYNQSFYDAQKDGSYRSAKIFASWIMDIWAPISVVDLGCGVGTWLTAFHEAGSKRVVGYDGPWNLQEKMLNQAIAFVPADLNESIKSEEKFELAISLEVAEHCRPESSSNFVESLVSMSDVIMFGAAYTEQPGVDHINTRPHSFWSEKFREHGYMLFDFFRPQFWGDTRVEAWYRQNTFLYVKPGHKLYNILVSHGHLPLANPAFVDCVHPWLDDFRRSQIHFLQERLRTLECELHAEKNRALVPTV